jgi:hypothetical protein
MSVKLTSFSLLQDNKPKTLLSWGSIADGAQWLTVLCSQDYLKTSFSGEARHPTSWSVQIAGSRC